MLLFQRHPNLALLLIWMVATAFNLTKAVHIDDTIYLEIARWINVSPLHPLSGQVNWVNTLEPNYRISSSPLLFIYGMALTLRWFGESEIALHGLMALFTGLCVWGFYGLSSVLRLNHKLALTSMLALGPALIPSQNLMLDVPLLAFSILFFWALLATRDATSSRKTTLFVLAGLAAGAAALTKYPGLVLIPLLALYLVANRQLVYSWVVLIPLSMFGAWCAFNVSDYGGIHLLLPHRGTSPVSALALLQVPRRFLDGLVCLGAVSPFAIFGVAYLKQGQVRRYCLFGTAAVGLVTFIISFFFQGEDLIPALLRVLFLSLALILLSALAHALWRAGVRGTITPGEAEISSQSPPIFRLMLLAWLLLGFIFVLVFVPFMAVRHVLTLMPAILLLAGLLIFPKLSRHAITGATTITVLMGMWMGIADWQMADVGRTQAQKIRAALPANANIYFVGHWGWQWYAAKSGMRQYDLNKTELLAGDYLVAPQIIGTVPVNSRYAPYMKPIQDFVVQPSTPLLCRTISTQPAANFYGGGWNPLPWTYSSQPLETFTVFQISPTPVESLP